MSTTEPTLIREVKQTAQNAENEANKVPVPLTSRMGLVNFVKQLFGQIGQDHVGGFAGNLAYQGLFALFPFMVFLLSLLGILHATSLVNTLINHMSATMPPEAIKLLRQVNTSITKSHATGAFTVGAVVSVLAALWGVSGAFRAVMEATNEMYDVKESRPFWKQYLISILLAMGATALLISALVLVVFGPQIGGWVAGQVGLGVAFQWAWNILQWPVLVAFVMLAFALIYYFAPDVQQKFTFISPGTVSAVAGWLIFSLLFSLYVANFGSYNKTYGTLAGLAIFLLYLYYSAFIMLIGAEINQIVEANNPEGKDPGEKHPDSTPQESSSNKSTLQVLQENRPR